MLVTDKLELSIVTPQDATTESSTRGRVPPLGRQTSAAPTRRNWTRRIRVLVVTGSLLLTLLLGEFAARSYWRLAWGVPVLQPEQIWYRFYPEVRDSQVEFTPAESDHDVFEVLLLGGSVLHGDFGSIAVDFGSDLAEQLGRPVRVFNLAHVARTTRDSLLKYRRLADRRFDLVVVYHGINDVRMNNCPRAMFRSDYSHSGWYAAIERFGKHRELPWLVLPFSVDYLRMQIADELNCYVPRHRPHADWTSHGGDVKTEATFRANLSSIVSLAEAKGEPVVLMTFAHYLAPGYSERAFRERRLDYHPAGGAPVELWGAPEHVLRALARHNQIVAELAARSPNAMAVDQAARIPRDGRYFHDICHLSESGCRRFVRNLVDGVADAPQMAGARVKPTAPLGQ